MKFHLFLLSLLSCQAIAYYHFHEEFKEDNERSILKDSQINFSTKEGEKFPSSFTFGFKSDEQNLKFEFLLSETFESHVHANDGRSFRSVEKKTEYRQYSDLKQNAVATVIENDLSNEKYRYMISYHNPLTKQQIDIYPVLEGNTLRHAIHKRSKSSEEEKKFFSFAESKLKEKRSESKLLTRKTSQTSRTKRAPNQRQFYVETVVVSESRVYEKNKNLLNTNDEKTVQQYMKIFYAHLISAVNHRFYLSLYNTSSIMINIVLKGVVIETSLSQSNWSNPAVVGENNEQWQNADVVVVQSAFLEFSSYMRNLNLPYKYDYAVGVTLTSLTAPQTSSNLPLSLRSGYSGYTIVGGMCNLRTSYTIIEDSGFTAVSVFNHELGHSLGLQHDGVNNPCQPSDNFIEAPIIGLDGNGRNEYYYSLCSIRNLERQLIIAGKIRSSFKCLQNVPVQSSLLPEDIYNNDYLPGQLWTVDQQCELAFGLTDTSAKACGLNPNEMCTTLYCLVPLKNMCYATEGWGAADGTKCDTGKICLSGQCVSGNATAPPEYPCSTNPCVNGGVCKNTFQFHVCICSNGFTGLNCENAV